MGMFFRIKYSNSSKRAVSFFNVLNNNSFPMPKQNTQEGNHELLSAMPYLVYVPDVDIDVGGTEDPYSEGTVDGPEGFGGGLSVHVGRGGGDAPGVGGHGEGVQGQLRVQALLGHQHQVGHAAKHDAAPDVLQGNTQNDVSFQSLHSW